MRRRRSSSAPNAASASPASRASPRRSSSRAGEPRVDRVERDVAVDQLRGRRAQKIRRRAGVEARAEDEHPRQVQRARVARLRAGDPHAEPADPDEVDPPAREQPPPLLGRRVVDPVDPQALHERPQRRRRSDLDVGAHSLKRRPRPAAGRGRTRRARRTAAPTWRRRRPARGRAAAGRVQQRLRRRPRRQPVAQLCQPLGDRGRRGGVDGRAAGEHRERAVELRERAVAARRARERAAEQAQLEHAERVDVVDQPGDRVHVELVQRGSRRRAWGWAARDRPRRARGRRRRPGRTCPPACPRATARSAAGRRRRVPRCAAITATMRRPRSGAGTPSRSGSER